MLKFLYRMGTPKRYKPGSTTETPFYPLQNAWPARWASNLSGDSSGYTRTTVPGPLVIKKMPGPQSIKIGQITIPMNTVKEAELGSDPTTIASGTHAEINIPSTLLRNYDVVVDYPNRRFTIAAPGAVHFRGRAFKAIFNPQNGLIQVAGTIDNARYNLALDLGTPVSFISSDLIRKWLFAHPSWPHTKGAVGLSNLWGMQDEPQWELLRIPGMLFGTEALPGVVAVSFPADRLDYFQKRAGVPTIGLMGAGSLLNYRVGIDYRNSTVYFQKIGRSIPVTLNVVGLVLRPGSDGQYSIVGVANHNGKASVPGAQKGDLLLKVDNRPVTGLTMGQVWSLLGGAPGEQRTLTLGRQGKELTLKARVQKFL
jgi:hypothetical protein